jgi:hypothetical protein
MCAVAVYTLGIAARAQMPDPPGQVVGDDPTVNAAYLFAHLPMLITAGFTTASASTGYTGGR